MSGDVAIQDRTKYQCVCFCFRRKAVGSILPSFKEQSDMYIIILCIMIMYIQYIYIDIHYVSAIFTWKYISNDKPLVSKPTDLGNILTWSWNIWRSNLQPGRHLRLNCLPLSLWQERGLGKPTTQKTFWGFGKKKKVQENTSAAQIGGKESIVLILALSFCSLKCPE